MRRWFSIVATTFLLLTGSMWGQQDQQGPPRGPGSGQPGRPSEPPPVPKGSDWSDWATTSNNANIAYRYRMLNSGKACLVEFKDQNQQEGYTSFDAAVEYQSISSNGNGDQVRKTDNLHFATTPNHNGISQIPNCFGVVDANVNFVKRH